MMQTLLITASSVALILFVAFVASRLLRSRTAGLSIRMQIFLALAAIVGAFAFGLGLLVIDRVKARATLLAEESARSEATTIASIVADEMAQRDKTLDAVAHDLAGLRQDVRLTLLAPDGTAILSSARAEPAERPGFVSVTVPITIDGAGRGAVRVDKPTIVIQNMLADFAPSILVISVVLGAAAALAAALIGRTIAAPIEQLAEFAERVSEGERRVATPVAHGREVLRLTGAIDTMRRELEGRPFVETFAADLSHELKNPVAAIRASAEVLADGALEEPAEASRFVGRIQEATSRIEILLGELLSLARIEARGVQDAAVVDLETIAGEAVARASERGADATLESVGASPVRGDPLWLARLVDNLVDNALVHGSGRRIRARLAHEGGDVVLEVESAGQVVEHVRRRLFRRFVTTRPDKGGSGLGLAIVRAVAEAHGGSVACSSWGPPEVVFRVRLPAA